MARFMHAHGVDCGIEGCADGRETLGYFSGDGRRRTASGHGPTLPNPEGGDTWYHGTRFGMDDEGMHGGGDYDHDDYHDDYTQDEKEGWGGGKVTGPERSAYEIGENADKHWNTDLGAHFTSLKPVARSFAGGGGLHGMTSTPSMGRVLHAGLHMSNPAVFTDEREMGAHAAKWAHKEGYRFHSPYGNAKEPVNEDHYDELRHGNYWHEGEDGELPYEHLGNYSGAHPEPAVDIDKHGVQPRHTQEHLDEYLANHPNREEITTGWKSHLKRQGHDGILYGNTLEGPHGHACAITLDDSTIHHRKWEWLNEHDRHEYDYQHGETYKPSTSGAGQWDKEWHSRDGRKPYTGSRRHVAESYNRKTAIHEHVIDPFEPTERLFAPTKDHLDETLFDGQEGMRPEVRKEILKVTDHFFDTHGYTGHERWARVFLAGSQASYWGGNHDFDLLIGINYPIFRQAHPELDHLSDVEVDRRFNEQLRDDFNMDGWRPSFDPHGEPWDRTGYVNHSSWVISEIKPYAAYNVTDDVWAVRPIKEPEGHEFVTTEWYYFEGVASQILAAMKLQEPARTQTLRHIWDWVHGDRSRAFGPNGAGAFDRSNALEKYLSQYPAPGHPDGVYLMDLLRDAKYGKPTQHQGMVSYHHESTRGQQAQAKEVSNLHRVSGVQDTGSVRGYEEYLQGMRQQAAGGEDEGSAERRHTHGVREVRQDVPGVRVQQDNRMPGVQREVLPRVQAAPSGERSRVRREAASVPAELASQEDLWDHAGAVRGQAGGAGREVSDLWGDQRGVRQGVSVRGSQPQHRGAEGSSVRSVQPLGEGPGRRSRTGEEGAGVRREASSPVDLDQAPSTTPGVSLMAALADERFGRASKTGAAASDYFSGGVDDLLEAPFQQVPHQKIRLDEGYWKGLPVKDVPLEGLKRTQKSIFKKHLTRNDKVENGGNDDLPWVIHHGGEHWVIDGHHRAVNAMQRGDSTFRAHVMQSPFDEPHSDERPKTALLGFGEFTKQAAATLAPAAQDLQITREHYPYGGSKYLDQYPAPGGAVGYHLMDVLREAKYGKPTQHQKTASSGLSLTPTGNDFNKHITEHQVDGHGFSVPEEEGWTTKVRFQQSDHPDLNHRIWVYQEHPPAIKGFDPFRKDVGWMSYHPDTGRVEGIQTHENFARRGVATGMWNLAKQLHEQIGTVQPAHSETQTVDGKAWAEKTAVLGYGEFMEVLRGAKYGLQATASSGMKWYHGSPTRFDRFNPGGAAPDGHLSDWNTHIGPHFTSSHETARSEFAGPKGHVYSVSLDMKNPKVYESENEMSREVATHEIKRGNGLPNHPQTSEQWDEVYDEDPELYDGHGFEAAVRRNGGADDDRADYWMGSHSPEKHSQMARDYVSRLKSQGHDGIVYGNEIEGSLGHHCAIPFSPDQIKINHVSVKNRESSDVEIVSSKYGLQATAGASGDLPDGLHIEYKPYESKLNGLVISDHEVNAYVPDSDGGSKQVGTMKLDSTHDHLADQGKVAFDPNHPRPINWVHVDSDYRRRGIGEAMFEHAVGRGLNPADGSLKFPDGKDFAKEIQKRHQLPVTSSRVAMAAADDDWRMEHRPPDRDGIPLHDMTANLPADVYTHPHYYADMNDSSTQDSVSVMRRVRGKPDAKVKIYRALPAEHAHKGINPGDWVTTSKEYARMHGSQDDPKYDWPVISATVRAGDLHTDGDDFREYGYNGDKSMPGNIAHKGGYHQEVSKKADGTISPVVRRSQSPVKGYDIRHDPQEFDDFIAGRGGVTARDSQGNYAGHMRWDEDGVFSQNVHEDHQHVADHLIRKMRQQVPKIHRQAALSGNDWEISRKHVPTGGSKFGERYELSAMDSDGKRQGWVRYHEPKRKGSPMHVEEVRGDVPGVASHLLNHMESLHPNASRTVFLNDDTKRDKNTPSHTGGDHGKPTDWDQHYDSIGDLHRGFVVRMDPHDARKVNSADRVPEDHVKTLLSQIGGGRAGTHWTSGLRESQNFSQRNQSDPRTDIPVILHAQKPERKDIETRPSELFRHGVFPYDHVEKEVPIRKGRDVVLTGMSWKPDVAHPDADEDGWLHHTFTEPFTKSASLESVASFDPTGEQGWSEIRRQGGANGDLPEGLHFTHGTHEDLPRKYPWIVRPGEHAVRAHVGDKIIGHVKWQSEDAIKGNRKAGWINELGVDSDYHRRGVGSALVDKAKEIDPRVHISTDLTDDGKAWAKGYQGRTASAGDVQYISHQELRNMYSGDYDAPMGKAHGSMLRDWRDYKNGELDQDDIHSGELEHGGPTAHIRHLQDDIAQNGLKDPLVIRGGNVVVDGNHRGVAALNLRLDKIPVRHVAHRKEGSDDMATKSAYATGQRRIAMPWFNNDDGVNPSHAKSVRDAGYAGYVGDSERDEELGHGGYGGHEDEFDEDLWDHVAPHPTHEEKRHMDEHGEYPDSYHERHDEAYGEAQHRKAQEDEMDHDDPDLHRFIGEHGSNAALWKEKGTFGKVNIKDQPVYATQSHVNQQHIDHYTASPGDISHSMRNTPGYGKTHAQNPYLADEHPMFVTHEGRLHVTDGHHRVAAALQSGQKHIMGWHYDGDEHGFPDEDGDDWGHHTSSRVQRRPESSSLSAYAKLVLADSTALPYPEINPEHLSTPDACCSHQRQVEDEETRTREGVTHAGLIVKANDTGRVVVLQRSYKDEEDPARGMLEFPGGGIEPGESAYQAACREWQEETGAHLPEGDPSGSFISNGLYKGFIMVVPSEDDVDIHEAAAHSNPDDPFRLDPEVVMWIDIEHLADGPATRDEVKTGTDWDMLRRAAL